MMKLKCLDLFKYAEFFDNAHCPILDGNTIFGQIWSKKSKWSTFCHGA